MVTSTYQFDQPVLLRRSPRVSHAVVWGVMGVTTFSVAWASIAKVEEAIPALGKLEPQGEVRDVQVPLSGVVKSVAVTEGQRVKKGDLLLTLDPTAAQAQLVSLQQVRTTLIQENRFYRSQMTGVASPVQVDQELLSLNVKTELASLTKSRSALLAENQLYRSQLRGSAQGANLTPEQQLRLQSNLAEIASRAMTARLEVKQLEQQLNQNRVKIASSRDLLAVNQGILQDIKPVMQEGAISRFQFLQRQQEVRRSQSEVDELLQEQARIRFAIAQSQERIQNTYALYMQDLYTKIAENEKRIAEVDTQLNKAIVENEKRIAEIDGQIRQAKLTLQYQEVRAPISGTVFELKANSGSVTNPNVPLLKVVPEDALFAKVYITNRDIGFVKEGMPVDVRVDSFPFSEFGDVKGELISIGSDALPPTEIRPEFTFPAKVRLKQQLISVNGRKVPLQSGMSVNANIKLRQRTVMSIFTDSFTQQLDGFKFVR